MRALPISVTFMLVVFMATSTDARPLKHWGFKAGFTSATLEWEHDFISDEDISRRLGFNIGAFTEWFDYRGLSFVIGMNYERKGSGLRSVAINVMGQVVEEKTTYSRADYLSFPLLIKYTIGAAKVAPYLLAGPRVDLFLGYGKGRDDLVWGIEDRWDDVVFGLSGGFGIEATPLTSRTFFVEFVYNYDPFWLYEFTNVMTGNEQRVRSNSFNISVGIGL